MLAQLYFKKLDSISNRFNTTVKLHVLPDYNIMVSNGNTIIKEIKLDRKLFI